ncbi:MAG: cobalt-precorrin-5B (C(1))-methyltransferase CbiD [Clostridia bacterium]|nr:cobalt-precorrin-5B (C(1))-methyltransferase CbiD [Clostridia bacterium]
MELKKGYTTGTCAAIAVMASIRMIFEQKFIKKESIITPKGVKIETEILEPEFNHRYASCAVKKYSGDDPDVTNGILLFATVKLTNNNSISLDGGTGIGRVTKPGLWQNIGEAAINKVPRQMILENTMKLFDEYGYEGGADIVISAPEGEEIAKKTFNPRLGIKGGISILGTSGIVEPMSEKAIIDTIKIELNVKKANEGDYVMVAPGNYGIDFIKEKFNVDLNKAVKCSNYIGETLDFSYNAGFKGILLIGHIGKFIKLAGGIMNTHSKYADSRMEIFAANTAKVCNDITLIRNLLDCITTDDAVKLLKEAGICDKVMKKIIERASFYINNRVNNEIETGILMFSNVYGILGASNNVVGMLNLFK